MKLVQTLVVSGEPDLLDAQVAYHLNAGVDLVVASLGGSASPPSEVLARYEREGRRGSAATTMSTGETCRTHLARLAAVEHGADWVINSEAGEFWWPRAESLKDVLAPIPPRYTIVQALRRQFLPRPGDGPFSERMTARRSLSDGETLPQPPAALLRSVHRADPRVVVHADGTLELSRLMPLRAWYPLEVLDFRGAEADSELADDSIVHDVRLRDALRMLGSPPADHKLVFPVPDIVDDAAYAVECAAVGEVDLPRLEQYITELEQRIDWLEQRFWPRILRRVSGLRRSGR